LANWLLEEEPPIKRSLLLSIDSRAAPVKETYSVILHRVIIISNGRLFGKANLIGYFIIVNGYPDMKTGNPFWAQRLDFYNVRDGQAFVYDSNGDTGYLLFRGRPKDFLNLYFLVVKDNQSTRDFARILKANFASEGIGLAVGAAVSIFSGLPPTATGIDAYNLTKKAVDITLDYFSQQRNTVIGIYRTSLLKENDYGFGWHPPDYDPSDAFPRLKKCSDAVEIAYEVGKTQS
jgi:hypothetical protein